MKKYIWIVIAICCTTTAQTQQLFQRSDFRELSFTWNPAMTATNDYWEAFAAYRRQWAGFEGSPRTAAIGISYPFLDYNMSLGGLFVQDHIQPIQNTTLGATYAYHLEIGLFNNDRLSVGLSGIMNQFSVDALELQVIDPDDVNIPIGEKTTFNFNAGAGFYYVSNDNIRGLENYFFVGAAANQAFANDLRFDNKDGQVNFKRSIHANATIGGHFVSDYFFIEPYLWANYAYPNIFNVSAGVIMEIYDTAWGGLSYNTNESASFQAGYIVKDWFLQQNNTIRIGGLVTINTGSLGQPRGLTYEFYLAYRFEI